MNKENERTGFEIAVVGLAGRFPGARDIEEYWQKIKGGVECISFLSEAEIRQSGIASALKTQSNYVAAKGGVIEDKEYFDPSFFGYAPYEAQLMDPQTRLFHEYAWKALEDAGFPFDRYKGAVGVYVGASNNTDWQAKCLTRGDKNIDEFSSSILRRPEFMPTMVSYKLNLTGPSVFINTGCSTSLVAIDNACRALLTGSCDLALAGGVSVWTQKETGYIFQEGMINSADGHCRAFDHNASGCIPGEGIGVVVLKRLEEAVKDRDHIYAVIKGFATNNDGNRKPNYSAPGIDGQLEAIRLAHMFSEIQADTIGYVEAHGTGTPLGDPIEIEALKQAFGTTRRNFCAIGAVKANIGHLDAAAGIAGFIKAVLVLKHRQIPPSINFEQPNPRIDFDNSPFFVNRQLFDWKVDDTPRRAAVSSFGIGGTNAHVILEEAPPDEEIPPITSPYHLLTFSAHSGTALARGVEELGDYFQRLDAGGLQDAAFTLNTGRKQLAHRKFVVAASVKEAASKLQRESFTLHYGSDVERERPIVFMFPGGGVQHINMAIDLYRDNNIFREEVDHCLSILQQLTPVDLRAVLYPAEGADQGGRIEETSTALPLLFTIEYSLARLMMRLGVIPAAMIGHSLGEFVAACLSGVFTLEDALRIVVIRSQLMESAPAGLMLSVAATDKDVLPLLAASLSLAAVNSPSHCLVAGGIEDINRLSHALDEKGIDNVILRISVASHSTMMNAIIEPFREAFNGISCHDPAIPYISNVTGTWISKEQAGDPAYYAAHLTNCVKFSAGIEVLLEKKDAIFLELGPGKSLLNALRQHDQRNTSLSAFHLMRHPREDVSDLYHFLTNIGALWLEGVSIDWGEYYRQAKCRHISLPSYSFDRQRFWIDDNDQEGDSLPAVHQEIDKRPMAEWFYAPVWQQSVISSHNSAGNTEGTWLVFGDKGAFSKAVCHVIEEEKVNLIRVDAGPGFCHPEGHQFTIDAAKPGDYVQLFQELIDRQLLPDTIVHLWNVTGRTPGDLTTEGINNGLQDGFFSLINIVQAMGKLEIVRKVKIVVISNRLHRFETDDAVDVWKSPLMAAVRIVPLEYDYISCKSIDIAEEADTAGVNSTFISALLEEIKEDSESIVAYRNKTRWIRVFQRLKLGHQRGRAVPLKQGGTYLIAGAFGGMGLSIAEHLAERWKANLVLIGRSWSEEREDVLRRLERAGARVLAFQADIADQDRMEEVFARSRAAFGRIDGIIHAAGVIDYGGIIHNRTVEDIRAYMSSKVIGVTVLHGFAKADPPDFVALFSSLGNMLYHVKAGQVAYNAANEFLDAYADYQTCKKDFFAVTIDWDDWRDSGMAVNAFNKYHAGSYDPEQHIGITKTEGVEAFETVLGAGLRRVIVSLTDLHSRIERFDGVYTSVKKPADEGGDAGMSAIPRLSRPALTTDYAEPVTLVEQQLAGVFAKFFGLEKVGVLDNFFELGGDSLKALYFLRLIERECSIRVPLKIFFQGPCVKALTDHLSTPSVGGKALPEMKPAAEKAFYPVSSAQKRIFLTQHLDAGSVAYNMPDVISFDEAIDAGKLHSAVMKLVERHEMLRTRFALKDGGIVQQVMPELAVWIENPGSETLQEAMASFVRPFNLDTLPLFRVAVFRDNYKNYVLIDKHHLIADGHSNAIFLRELISLYRESALPALTFQYKDFAEWEREFQETEEFRSQESFWERELQGDLPVLHLLPDTPRPPLQEFEGASMGFRLEAREVAEVERLARQENATIFMTFLAMYTVFLARVGNQDDIIVGSPSMGRPHQELDPLIGMFVNTLVFRNHPKMDQSFRDFLRQLKEQTIGVFGNQHYPFDKMVEKLSKDRDKSRNPIFDVCFVMQGGKHSIEEDAVHRENVYVNKTSKFDLTLEVTADDNGFYLKFEYRTSLFSPETIRRFTDYLRNIITAVLADPGQAIGDIGMLPEEERELLTKTFNSTHVGFPDSCTVHQLFEKQAESRAGAIALVSGDLHVSYGMLHAYSNRLAGELRQKGVNRNMIVPVVTEKADEMIAGMLAILKAGGAYLPIDPDFPKERIRFMMADTHSPLLLASRGWEASFFEGDIIPITIRDGNGEPAANLPNVNQQNDLLYVIYTSGTTGRPKGTLIGHRNVVRLLFNEGLMFDFARSDTWSLLHSFTFDFSVWEMYGALLYGGKLVHVPRMTAKDPRAVLELLQMHCVSVLNTTPSEFYNISACEAREERAGLHLDYVIFGGESLSPARLKQWKQRYPGTKNINMYGITETTVHVTYKEIDDSDTLRQDSPIGVPLSTTTVYILDSAGRLLPAGAIGEICVGGKGVARGYLNLPELTHERFVGSDLVPGERIYRSGDLGKALGGGEYIYKGRMDSQVKVRGFRIELGEIERAAMNHPAMLEVAAMVKEGADNDRSICLFYVGKPKIMPADMRKFLSELLPDYMIPAYLMELEVMPLTHNGKIDKKALSITGQVLQPAGERRSAGNSTEQILIDIWESVLGVSNITVEDNFFTIGGDSIKAIRVLDRINAELNKNVPMAALFQHSSVEELGAYLLQEKEGHSDAEKEAVMHEIDALKNKILSQ